MNTDKAYLIGLIIGGGIFGNAEDVFRIRLPYNKWGSYINNPSRAGKIAGDILSQVSQMFRIIYGLTVQYEAMPGGDWIILFEGDVSSVKRDLLKYGLPCEGEILRNADIELLVKDLVDDNLKRRFVAGLADIIGSMAESQRRFSEEHQIISFEIKGYNFKFVCDLCHLLYSINCIPDQVNWNHPNIHCPSNSYYRQWNKGFKLRILLDQYATFGAFTFRTKVESLNANRNLQRTTHRAMKCEESDVHVASSTIHFAENDPKLPEIIRGGHYIHFRHFCAVLGCEHAPYDKINSLLNRIGNFINPFPILCKDTLPNIERKISSDCLLSRCKFSKSQVDMHWLLQIYSDNKTSLLYGQSALNGYPIKEILKGVAYVIADSNELNGKRPKGNYTAVIERHLAIGRNLCVEVRKPDLLTTLVIIGNGRAALIGARNPEVYERLVTRDASNPYKIFVRQITEGDLTNAHQTK